MQRGTALSTALSTFSPHAAQHESIYTASHSALVCFRFDAHATPSRLSPPPPPLGGFGPRAAMSWAFSGGGSGGNPNVAPQSPGDSPHRRHPPQPAPKKNSKTAAAPERTRWPTTCRRSSPRASTTSPARPRCSRRALSRRLGNQVLLKREDQQPVFSFKLRGAYNKMAHLSAEQLQRGVICASAGNHAQGVALARREAGQGAVIVMPVTTPRSRSTRCARSAARWCCRRELLRRLPARQGSGARTGPDLRAPVRRPRRHRRPGHRRHGDPAPASRGPSTRCSSPSAAAG